MRVRQKLLCICSQMAFENSLSLIHKVEHPLFPVRVNWVRHWASCLLMSLLFGVIGSQALMSSLASVNS